VSPKERILQSALELFVEQGYFNTNVPDISRRSRCSVGSIYHHFLNKEEIADQIYKNGIQQFREILCNAISNSGSTKETVCSLVIAFLHFAENNRLLSQYLWLARHNEFLTETVRKPTGVGFDNLGRQLTKVIKSGIRSGEIPPIQAEIFWSIVFGIPLSFVRDWLDGYTKDDPHHVSQVIANACWAALQGAKKS
jgi:TetR/AcrR family transcriptional regulator, repressor of fatR-cypB operon